MVIKWKTTEFRQLHIDELNDFAQNLYKKILKMSREYKVKDMERVIQIELIHLG